MHNKNFYALLLAFLCLTHFAFGQVNVSPLTGTGYVSIPLFNVHKGSISVPVTLNYSAGGVKPLDAEGNAGMGWNVAAGGQISRVVRGLPDDCTKDGMSNPRKGWMYNSNQSTIAGFSITNNGNTCSNETADIANINSHFSYKSDTEPDIFMVSAPGLSCQLVYDQSISSFRPIAYQDLKISWTIGSDSTIKSFTIINDKGVKYVFASQETSTISTKALTATINYFANRYYQCQYNIYYTSAWHLSSMTDVNQQGVVFYYTAGSFTTGSDSTRVYEGGASTPSPQYLVTTSTTPENLTGISTLDEDVYTSVISLSWDTSGLSSTHQPLITSIAGYGRTVNFNYLNSITSADASNFSKAFLRNVYETGCSAPLNDSFSYAGETKVYIGGILNHYSTTLADSSSRKFDYWGYNSSTAVTIPKLYTTAGDTTYKPYTIAASSAQGSSYPYIVGTSSGAADPVAVLAGTLDTIRYATGGMTTITYQSNDYLDVPTNTVIQGGGIRVSQITDHDGLNEANNIVRTYSYLNPGTGISSGKPISLPQYAFIIPYSGATGGQTLWTLATAISSADLSQEDHTIEYGYVKMSQTDAGSTIYQYYLPAMNWDKTATPGCSGCSTIDWRPAMDYVGREVCTLTYGPIKNVAGGYPFMPNANYDVERGLLQSVIAYNDAGTKVKETDYTYQRSYSAVTAIPAFRYDEECSAAACAKGYGKYNVYASTSELTSKVVNTVYDSPTLSQAQTSTVNYVYGSSYHKLLTQQTTVNSDNTTLIKNIRYVKDYNVLTTNTNANINALYNLTLENANVPVENWSQLQNGSNTYTTAASLTLFNSFSGYNGTMYLPSQQYVLTLPNGETTFAPFAISGTTTTKDAGYQTTPVANFDTYDPEGALQTADDGHHHVKTNIVDHLSEQVAVSVANAAYNEFSYSDFNQTISTGAFNPLVVSGTYTTVPGHTGFGVVFNTGQTLASNTAVVKNAQANNYIFSCWINSGSNVGSITITFQLNIGGTIHSYIKTITGPGNTWKYYEWKLPVSGTSFYFSMSGSANISVDDAFLYPETAEITSYSYDPTTHFPASVSNTNGIATYYLYDVWGRKLYTYDRYKNIVQKNTYVSQSSETTFQGLSINGNLGVYQNSPAGLYIVLNGCATGLYNTYVWNFGDGSSPVTTTSPHAPSHTYTTVGTYTATCQVTSPVYGTETVSASVNVQTPVPTTVPLSYIWSSGLNSANVLSVDFYQGATKKYSYTAAQMSGSNTILSGTYDIKVYMATSASGYGSIQFAIGGGTNVCQNFVQNGGYIFTFSGTVIPVNSTGLQLQQLTGSCTGVE